MGNEPGQPTAGATHFLDVAPYPLHTSAEARELRNLISGAIYTPHDVAEALRLTGIPLDDVPWHLTARGLWGDVLDKESVAHRRGGARPFIEKLAARADDLRRGYLKERLETYLGKNPPVATPGVVEQAPYDLTFERTTGMRDAFVDVSFLPAVLQRCPSVAHLVASFTGRVQWGTGFLIAPGRMLTNHHVLVGVDGEVAHHVVARFDFERRADGSTRAPRDVPFHAGSIKTRPSDDVGVFDVDAQGDDRKPLVLANAPAPEQKVAIIQHPNGLPKQVAFHTVLSVERGLVHYLTDTSEGSSGAPVLDQHGHVVALHHASTRAQHGNERIVVNEGIAADRVREALRSLGLT